MALGALVTGVTAIAFSVIGVLILPLLVAVPASLVAIILGIVGRKRANRGAERGAMAIGGIITGALGLLISGLWIAGLLVFGGEFLDTFGDDIREFEECVEETGDEELCQQRLEERMERQLEERFGPDGDGG